MTSAWRKGKRVAIVGAGPGGLSAAIAFIKAGYDVRLYERATKPKPLGGAVLLAVPVMAILRYYGIDIVNNFGSKTITHFANHKGKVRATLPFNKSVEQAMGIDGWHYGILRMNAYDKMVTVLNQLDPGALVADHALNSYEDRADDILLRFENGAEVEADLLVGADGIRSVVSRQAFGEADLFHIGLRVWLAWCEDQPGIDRNHGYIHHSRDVQASYFPMKHDGRPGFEWWVVERSDPSVPPPADTRAHLLSRLDAFPPVLRQLAETTDFKTQVFPWEIYNRASLKSWCTGRVACVGDAVHPVSPYAAYGMGMAIEDGYFLARSFKGQDLSDRAALQGACAAYEADRVDYCNHHVEFARKLGGQFHKAPRPVAAIRDFVFDNTQVLQKLIGKDYLADAERMSLSLKELHVG
ncbi:FAD-dependent oxidoreductase [Pararhodobacter zhoushanensis]|uniref:FAD-dependent monooxygenase n=1 Tax=Pararhodobacter zhoushanensis TaxID=2479545 RepID=A0ABT3H5H4_9RHOB|nr:NAD(P)/FAD-dependent oxidoreductase [Pararhodobacter zhoushanensis]MCW1935063.1 FAD-dependent monooxygenase [Pararhodobacter zhoushanensis]